jgi:hypothetical protein
VRLTVTWPADQHTEIDFDGRGDVVALSRAAGLTAEDLEALKDERFTAEAASIGKGAAGTGVGLVLEMAEHVINDAASLAALGALLRAAIKRVSARRKRGPAVVSPDALSALAADHAGDSLPTEARYVKTVLLNGDEGMGTDERDVWAVCFAEDFQLTHVIFMSPTGLALGYVRVPTEWYVEGDELGTRSEEDIAAWWER